MTENHDTALECEHEGKLNCLRKQYPPGTRLRLLKMDDPMPPPIGGLGTVTGVDDAGQIMVRWDSGSGLSLVPGEDEFEIVKEG